MSHNFLTVIATIATILLSGANARAQCGAADPTCGSCDELLFGRGYCNGDEDLPSAQVEMNFGLGACHFWPDQNLTDPPEEIDGLEYSGRVRTDCLPGDYHSSWISAIGDSKRAIRDQLPEARGFSTTAGIFFRLTWSEFYGSSEVTVDPSTLPTRTPSYYDSQNRVCTDESSGNLGIDGTVAALDGSVTPPSAFLMDVDPDSPERWKRYPIITGFQSDWDCFGGGNGCQWNGALPDNALALVPLQGVPLRSNTLYAAVLTEDIKTINGRQLRPQSDTISCIMDSACTVPGLQPHAREEYLRAIETLGTSSTERQYDAWFMAPKIVSFTVFRTGNPTASFDRKLAFLDAEASEIGDIDPEALELDGFGEYPAGLDDHGGMKPGAAAGSPEAAALGVRTTLPVLSEDGTFGEFCVFTGHVTLADIALDADGKASATPEEARIWITLPRTPMPPAGYPVVIVERAGMGSDEAGLQGMIDHGATDAVLPDHATSRPGSGLALQLARAGYAAVQFDDYGSTFRGRFENNSYFDITKLPAIPNAIHNAALEVLTVATKTLPKINQGGFDASSCSVRQRACRFETLDANPLLSGAPTHDGVLRDCPSDDATDPAFDVEYQEGPQEVIFDLSKLAYFGHSVGAHIGPLVLYATYQSGPNAGKPIVKKGVLSGATGSMLATVLYKTSRTYVKINPAWAWQYFRDIAGSLYLTAHTLHGEQEPQLNVFQWSQEVADPPVFSRVIADRLSYYNAYDDTRQIILQIQAPHDSYITPPIANAVNLALGLGLAVDPGSPFGRDTDPMEYRDASGDPQFDLDGHGAFPHYSKWRTFSPYVDLVEFAGWGNESPAAAAGFVRQLPVAGSSAVIQPLDNLFVSRDGEREFAFQDSHEIVFQSLAVKRQLQCFLATGLPIDIPIVVGGEIIGTVPLQFPPVVPSSLDSDSGTCCAHTPCGEGPGLTTRSCEPCVARVCAIRPSCCQKGEGRWDAECVSLAENPKICEQRCTAE